MVCTLPTFSCFVSCIPLPPESDPAHDEAASQILDEDFEASEDIWLMNWSDDGECDEDWDASDVLEVGGDEILEVKKLCTNLNGDPAKCQPPADARHHKFGTRILLELVA
jgi:hypothetical protein